MIGHRAVLTIAWATLALAIGACDENPSFQKLGSMDITTSAPSVEKDIVTADGWTVKYDRFLVHVTGIEVAGTDQVLAASATAQIVDQVAPGSKSLLSAPVRTARPWEVVTFQIGPAVLDTETAIIEPVKEADRDMMQKDGLSFYVEGKASKAGIVKAFKWGFKTDTLYKDCEENRSGTVVRGLVVPPDGNDTADVGMAGEILFSDNLAAAGELRAEAIATADADGDGTVTLAELRAAPLDVARTVGGSYAIGTRAEIADLGAFVEAQTQSVVARFRATGKCTAEPVPAGP
ncbi:MAG TPA: EF-hand domain-containing protein [Labilithrix sp.]|nr:EF-hand domain-containing protein [Labilithrix sp.]